MTALAHPIAFYRELNPQTRRNLLRLAAFLAVLAVAAAAFLLSISPSLRPSLSQAGYAGVAIAALVASGGLVIPVPALLSACTAGALLNPWVVALIAGLCEGVGELTGYFLGYSGQDVINRRPFFQRLAGWMDRRGWLVLLLVSLVPNPVFDVVGIAAGALRYPVWRFLAVVWTGKILKFIGIAYACAYSLNWFLDLL